MDLLNEQSTTKYIVLTHRPCRDGFVASLCARKYYMNTYSPKYGDVMPIFWGIEPSKQFGDMETLIAKIKTDDTENKIKKIYIESFDIAFYPETIIGIINVNTQYEFNIRIMDHHKSSFDSWNELIVDDNTLKHDINVSNIYKRVIKVYSSRVEFMCNMSECGASLAWQYYFPDLPIPLFIEYVKDRDNWLFDTADAKARYSVEVNEYLMANSPDYNDYQTWFTYFDKTAEYFNDTAYNGGKNLMNMKKSNVNAIMSVGIIRKIGQHNVYVCNSPIFVSDVGNIACEKYNTDESVPPQRSYTCDYAMIWRYDEKCKKYCVSLRSRKGGIDVQEIAKKFGGGGHENASGFETDTMDFLQNISTATNSAI